LLLYSLQLRLMFYSLDHFQYQNSFSGKILYIGRYLMNTSLESILAGLELGIATLKSLVYCTK
jgi:hypothetical protein